MSNLPTVALIAGPTASGKSALAMALAERHGGTIVNADASQVYADLRVLSARPSPADEARVPHRLFGHVDGADTGYTTVRWAAEARAAIAGSVRDGRLPIVVGGTGLYLRTLLDGIAPIPEIAPDVRAEVRALPAAEAHRALQVEDPLAAARLAATDTTRLHRALEVVRGTGRPISEWQGRRTGGIAGSVRIAPIVLMPPRDWLRARCDARLVAMWPDAVTEVKALLDRPDVPATAAVRRAIGVAEIAAWLDGATSGEAALHHAQAATRQYAKRQSTWLRHQLPRDWPRLEWTQTPDHLAALEILLRK